MARKGTVVKSEMSGGFGRPSMTGTKGMYDRGPAPFDKPRSMGNGAVPTKFMDSGVSKTPTPTQTTGADTRAARPGTSQRKYGTSNQ